ncbi:unnamed protein product, partial [Ceratitis capitata]
ESSRLKKSPFDGSRHNLTIGLTNSPLGVFNHSDYIAFLEITQKTKPVRPALQTHPSCLIADMSCHR